MKHLKSTLSVLLIMYASFSDAEPLSKAFELRYFTGSILANGETDFKGSTAVFNTDQRIAFLKYYAEFAKDYFQDTNFDYEVVSDQEAIKTAMKIKPQPLPEIRNRIILDEWKWLGYRDGQDQEDADKLSKYTNQDVRLVDGMLVTAKSNSVYTWKFPGQSWRCSFTWKAKVPSTVSKAVFCFSELGKIPVAEVGFNEKGMLFYVTTGNKIIETEDYLANKWYEFKIEFDYAGSIDNRRDLGRYNLYIDGKQVADYVLMQAAEDNPAPTYLLSNAKVDRLTLKASQDVCLSGIWGVGYQKTDRQAFPYNIGTFLDERFKTKPSAHGWMDTDYDDNQWEIDILPIVHGSERFAGEDLFLRKKVYVGDFDKAYLNIATLDPGGEVWVNGKVAAVVTDRPSQKIDLTRFLDKNKENLIAVKVNSFFLTKDVGEVMPHSALDLNIGWFAGKMSLDILNLTSIDDIFVYTKSLKLSKANQIARVKIENKYWEAFRGRLEMNLYPWFPEESSVPVATQTVELELPHNISELEIPFEVDHPKLWTPENPCLYKVHFVLKDKGGNKIDDFVTTTGIRTVDQSGGSFRLNGNVSMLNGAQIMGYRSPLEDMIKKALSPDDYSIAKEILQIKKMNGNFLRMHVHNWDMPSRGVNDSRYAEYADQMGIMLLWCPTAWIRTGRGWGDVDFENYPKYMQQVINHPSIVMWELANHTQAFKKNPVSESNIYCEQAYNTVYPADPSRLISYNSFIQHMHYGNDEGTVDQEGNPIHPSWAWTAPNVTRGNQDSPTGYGNEWSDLRKWPDVYRTSFLNSKDRAYFNFEHQESAGQPNWALVKGKPWYLLQSYEWYYDEGSIGRKLSIHEWRESQAWQAFSAWEAMKKMRFLGYDGFSWCCLDGGANSVTYQKPLIDFLGHAKLVWHANKMVFQKTVAGSRNVDIVYGPDDKIEPVVMNWNKKQTVDVTVKVLGVDKKEVAKKVYKNVFLESGRTVCVLEPFRPECVTDGYYFVIYEIDKSEVSSN